MRYLGYYYSAKTKSLILFALEMINLLLNAIFNMLTVFRADVNFNLVFSKVIWLI